MITSPQDTIEQYQKNGLWEGVLLHQWLQRCADASPQQLAIADQPTRTTLAGEPPLRLTFLQLQRASTNLAAQLLQQGIGREDRVIVQLPNIAELVVCYMAVSAIGAIISPLPVQYGGHELKHVDQALSAKAYIAIETLNGQAFAEPQSQHLSDGCRLLCFGQSLSLDTQENQAAASVLAEHQQQQSLSANDIFTVCWTSGTTGMPKGVPRSHNMWGTVGRNCIEAGDYQQGDRLLNPFPLVNMASVGSFLYPFVMLGCSLVLHHPFDPPVFLQQIQAEAINFTIVPPAMLNQLAKNEALWNPFDFSQLRSIGSGSAPLSPWMIDIFDNRYQKKIVNYYGSNEGINLFAKPETAPDAETRASMFPRFGAAGIDWPTAAARTIATKVIDPESGAEITEPGKAGELVVKGPTVFAGYWQTDNRDVFTEDGFFKTGDLVEICGEGDRFYRIAGRSKDIINRGGMKLSPAEIDVLLEGLPGAVEAAVCAYPDEDMGEKICACVVAENTEQPLGLDDIKSYLLEKGIAKIKLPERLELFERLPRNPLGKVQRFMLQDTVASR
ncbi:MAG: class I adenylate-forming enzyme family protein [Candidatus Pelagadaptatus aseana]|uniref:class I adenylate-forming enzyme family protein n=1 Tax=Candidatus Pelagadaptatus aseana TaxID=3120508 RepID=UPI0039B17A55